jgi:hypothetical protein
MDHQPKARSTRRITLPSGRTIEVVCFSPSDAVVPGLHTCQQCDSDLVQPVAWTEAPNGFWELVLQCPNCFWQHAGRFDQSRVDALEESLDEGLADMLDDLRRLTQLNMSDEIDRFAAALHADLILPEDF